MVYYNLIQGKAELALKNWKKRFGDQREDSLTSLELYYNENKLLHCLARYEKVYLQCGGELCS